MGQDHHHGFDPSMSGREMLAGGLAGLSEHCCTFPFDTMKTRMQHEPGRFASLRSVFLHMARHEPWTHFFRGCTPVVLSAFPAHAAYFGGYEAAKRFTEADGALAYASCGAVAAAGHDLVSVPFDVVKQHMQVDGGRAHRSSLACLQQVVKARGVGALWRSYPTTVAMNIPHISTHWVVYEGIRARLRIEEAEEDHLSAKTFTAGFLAGGAAAVASTPLDVCKTQIQLHRCETLLSALRHVTAERGLIALFSGAAPRVCYMAPSAGIVMATYEVVKSLTLPSPAAALALPAGGGAAADDVTLPPGAVLPTEAVPAAAV